MVSIIGLNSSAYGFEGLEASMMMDPRLAVGNGAHVITHDKQPTERGNKDLVGRKRSGCICCLITYYFSWIGKTRAVDVRLHMNKRIVSPLLSELAL